MTGLERINLVLASGEVFTAIEKAVGQTDPAQEKAALEKAVEKAGRLEQLLREYADQKPDGSAAGASSAEV